MTDMTAFERQLSGEMSDLMGSVRPVDDAAIFTAITTTALLPAGRLRSAFSGFKLVVAGATVALFGGFLLVSIQTQPSENSAPAAVTASPSPVMTDGLMSHLVTEEVEPGVLSILSDGAGHDLVADPPVGLTIGPDGEVVLLAAVTRPPYPATIDRVYVLGEEGTEPLPGDGDADIYWMDSAVDDDGVLWVYLGQTGDGGRLGRFDGSTWTIPTWPNGSGEVHAIEATSDGAVWVTLAGNSSGRPKVARIKDGVWTVLPAEVDGSTSGSHDDVSSSYNANGRSYAGYASDFAAAADGTAWLAKGDGVGRKLPPGTDGLLHFDGERWQVVELPFDPSMGYVGPLALGPDGTLWVYAATKPSGRSVAELARLQGGEWTVFTEADGVPVLARYNMHSARLAVDGEGTLWVAFNGDPVAPVSLPPPLGPSDPPHGVLSFDGATWRQYLKGQDVNAVAMGPDGSIWVTSLMDCTGSPECRADEIGGGGLYVIVPEAVTATE